MNVKRKGGKCGHAVGGQKECPEALDLYDQSLKVSKKAVFSVNTINIFYSEPLLPNNIFFTQPAGEERHLNLPKVGA